MVRVILDNDRDISHGCSSPDISDKHHEEVHKPEKVLIVAEGGSRQEARPEVHDQVPQIPDQHQTKNPELGISAHFSTTFPTPTTD